MTPRDPVDVLKQQLARELINALKGWKPTEIYFRLRLDQPRVWELRRGKLERFSLQRLVRLLGEMRYEVVVTVSKQPSVQPLKRGVSRS